MRILTVSMQDSIKIGDNVSVTIKTLTGVKPSVKPNVKQVHVEVDAPKQMKITRYESRRPILHLLEKINTSQV